MTIEQTPSEPGQRTLSGADLLLRSLTDRGVEAVYINPGTDTAPFQHAFELARAEGRAAPELILCPHETVALAAAHAHFAVTGRVQAVFVHVDVGTQNLGSMVHNAMRAEAGVLIIAGLTPYDETGTVPGGRNHTVHWMQDVPDQHAVVRQYVKASFNPARASLVHGTIQRALDIAAAAPSGPVYVTLGRELLIEGAAEPEAPRIAASLVAGPSVEAVRASLHELRASVHPVLVTTRIGQDPEAVAPFIRLAELLGAKVIDQRERMNFPANHPLATTEGAAAAWAEADLAVVIDAPVPWILAGEGPRAGCRILHVDIDPFQTTMPNWAFPADLRITSSPRLWVEAMVQALEAEGVTAAPAAQLAAVPRRAAPAGESGGDHLTPDDVLSALADLLTDDDRLIDEGATSSVAVARRLPRTRPATLYRSGGSGLGWSLGALLGMQIADPARASLVVVGDGGFMFGAPIAALTALHRAKVAGLVVVMQNGGYAASSRPVYQLFPDPDRGQPPATAFETDIDIAAIARACGAIGVSVRSSDDLAEALDQAVTAWRSGGLVVVGATVTSPWLGSAPE